jgi:hypothetical protein
MAALPDDERARLAQRYAEMSEAGLAELAENGYSLTESARGLLQAEISRRGLALAIQTSPIDLHPDPHLIVVRRFRDLPDALVAQSVLDSAGLQSSLFDENIIRLNWFYSYAMKEVKLMTSLEEAQDALALLDAKPPDSFHATTGEYVQPRCSACQSPAVSNKPLIGAAAYTLAFFGVPISFRREAWFCRACHHQWSDTGEPLPELHWPLIATLWCLGFLVAIVAFAGGINDVFVWLWCGWVAISAVGIARIATHRRFIHAFIVGFAVGSIKWLATCSFLNRHAGPSDPGIIVVLILMGTVYIGTLQALILAAFTWLATLFNGKHPGDNSHPKSQPVQIR